MILVHLFKVSKSVDEVSNYLVRLAEQRASPYYRTISYLRTTPLISPVAEIECMIGGIVEVRFYRDEATVSRETDHLGIVCYRLRSTGEPISGYALAATLHPLLDGTYVEFACYDDDYRPEFGSMLEKLGQSLPKNEYSAPCPDPEEPEPPQESLQEIITTEYAVAPHPQETLPAPEPTPTSPTPVAQTASEELPAMEPGASSPLTFQQANSLALLAEQVARQTLSLALLAEQVARQTLLAQSSLVHLANKTAEVASIAQDIAGFVHPLAHLVDAMRPWRTSIAIMRYRRQVERISVAQSIAPMGIPSAEAIGTPGLIAHPPIKGEGHGLLDLAVSATGTVENHIAVADAVHIREALNVIIAHGATFDDIEAIVSMFNFNFTVWLQRFDQRNEERFTRLEARMDQLLPQQPSDQYVQGALKKRIEKIAANQTLDAYRRLCEITVILEAEGLTMPARELARLLGVSLTTVHTYQTRFRQSTENLY